MLLDSRLVTRTAYQPVLTGRERVVVRRDLDQEGAQHDHQEQVKDRSPANQSTTSASRHNTATGAPTT